VSNQKLAAAVVARRKQLQLTQADVEHLGGPSVPTIRNIEHANVNLRGRTVRALARALQWDSMSVIEVVRGERDRPVPLVAAENQADRLGLLASPAESAAPNEVGFEDLADLVPKLALPELNRLMDMVRTAIAIREGGVA
jgi:transcriptional regulator with XRE-family HTH domain